MKTAPTNFKRNKSSHPKFEHKHSSFYPAVSLPQLIQENLPKRVMVEKSVLVDAKPIPTHQIGSIEYSQTVSYLGLLVGESLIAIVLRLFDVYVHNGIAIASTVMMIVALLLLGRQMDKERAAVAKRERRASPQPQFKTVMVEEWQVADWQILAGKVRPHTDVSSAKIGASEADFEQYLKKYFQDILKPSYSFEIPNTDKVYSADFCLVLGSGLSFCLEIDEPYVWMTKEPHHCIDQGKDEQRDKFFLDGHWIVIRFSEKQVVTQPESCCFLIAKTIAKLTGDVQFIEKLDRSIKIPEPEQRWTIAEAEAMARIDYRRSYLK